MEKESLSERIWNWTKDHKVALLKTVGIGIVLGALGDATMYTDVIPNFGKNENAERIVPRWNDWFDWFK